ncbi:hypothetical protein [Sphingomonas sp. SUN039]|uniref:hypothetical protein n=1 Tax=Sphingomonas sp. SUN039 TaxID=2937787 RepID=UPI0021640FB6|nr:hypothetical protein [Sphingomonas sp. SUN039]UVO54897.1 hypothetical protein M0209_12465 [Sphingomonas sp. SUN039]
MASTTSKADSADWPGKRIDHAEYGAKLAARRAELGYPELPRNSGANRTESKQALLKAIDDAAAKQGFCW